MKEFQNIIVFGEVLFDDFGDQGSILGGAPFNVAWHLQGFGFSPLFISRIGQDKNGQIVRKNMQDWGMNLAGLQTDRVYPTGLVKVDIREDEPQFKILADQAYDQIQISKNEIKLMDFPCDIIYHGTLALRSDKSYNALKNIFHTLDSKIFLDVNLRDPWWQANTLMESIRRANWLKCNTEEFKIIATLAEIGQPDQTKAAQQLCKKYDLQQVLITHGAQGARIVDNSGNSWQGAPKPVKHLTDTVGAGDGFSAVSLIGILLNWKIDKLLERAIEFAAEICRIRGATINDTGFYQNQLNNWK